MERGNTVLEISFHPTHILVIPLIKLLQYLKVEQTNIAQLTSLVLPQFHTPSLISHYCHLFLQGLLADEQVSGAPILVLGNKIDKPGAASEEELRTLFNLHSQTTGKVDLCICYKGEGGGGAVVLFVLANL